MVTSMTTPISRRIAGGAVEPGNPSPGVNVGETERWASLIGGGLLACYGLSRGTGVGLGLAALGGGLIYRGLTGHCSLYQALGTGSAAPRGATSVPAHSGVKVEKSVVIDRPREEVFRFWRTLSNLPRFMGHLRDVRETSPTRSRWVARGPAGTSVTWDAEIINERPNELIAWRSLPGSEVASAGSVHFLPAANGRGTEVRVSLKYDPPAGRLGAAVAWLAGEEPTAQVADDLARLKRMLEAGPRTADRLWPARG
jgi:uncharacterized membrane protein